MSLDPTTEAIAHFIGLFHTKIEDLRMRSEFDAFRAAKLLEPSPDDPVFVEIDVRAPYILKGFDPDVSYSATVAPAFAAQPPQLPVGLPLRSDPDLHLVPSDPNREPPVLDWGPAPPVAQMHLLIPLPNSILTLVQQSAFLSDNDLLLFGGTTPFVAPAVLQTELQGLVGTAQSAALAMAVDPGAVPKLADMQAFAAHLKLGPPDLPGAQTVMVTGAAAQGIFLNGAVAETLPVFTEILPDRLAKTYGTSPQDDAAGQTDADTPSPPPQTKDALASPMRSDGTTDAPPNIFAVEAGHAVVGGSNLSTNEAFISIKWVDAPVIAVAGDVMTLMAVSQVNLLVDRDITPDGVPVTGQINVALNAASITQTQSAALDVRTEDPDQTFPKLWHVETISGDLVLVNWIQQYVFATDFDRAEIQFSGAATFIGLGENVLSNLTALTELGYHYDLILIGGDMITLNQIRQTNVMLDSDVVSGVVPVGTDVQTAGNLQLNLASISTVGVDTVGAMQDNFKTMMDAFATGSKALTDAVVADTLFQGMQVLRVLYVEGDLTKVNLVDQTNVLGDADQVHLALAGFLSTQASPVTINTGGNAQLNAANILDIGIDSMVMAGGAIYSDALIHQAGLIDTDASPVGVGLAALASEAVAFLADGMIDPCGDPDIPIMPGLPDMPGSLDVMQSVLA